MITIFQVPATGAFWHTSPLTPDMAIGPYETAADATKGSALLLEEIEHHGIERVRKEGLYPGLVECELGALADLGGA